MSASLHWLEVHGRCRSWIEGIVGKVPSPEDLAPKAVPCGVLMQCSLRYASDTLDAIATELLAGRPLQAGVLTRTVFELAVRVRWASLHDEGWRRLAAYWVRKHKQSLEKLVKGYCDAEVVCRVDQALEDYRAFLKDVSCPQPGDFSQVLRQMVEKVEGGKNSEWSGLLYNGYRDLCRYAHANMTVCAGGIPTPEIGVVLLNNVAYATIQFVEASRAAFDVAVSEGQLDQLYSLPGLVDECVWKPEIQDV